jgi:hypothetical protein
MATETATAAQIHVQTWSGGGSLRITEMVNAGKAGKRCRILGFRGWLNTGTTEEAQRAHTLAVVARDWANRLDTSTTLEDAETALRALVAEFAPLPAYACEIYVDDIRGVDAPRPKLTAGVDGKWSASADENGVFVSEDADSYNEPAMCTPSSQSNARAYQLAAKVWGQVEQCQTFSQVGNVLRDAGCKLHYWCRMD